MNMRKEYIEREAAVMKIREWFWSAPGVHPKLDRDTAEEIMFAIPAADVVPVVRCKDCKYWNRERISCEGLARCNTGEGGIRFRQRNDFCSIGARMDGDGE